MYFPVYHARNIHSHSSSVSRPSYTPPDLGSYHPAFDGGSSSQTVRSDLDGDGGDLDVDGGLDGEFDDGDNE